MLWNEKLRRAIEDLSEPEAEDALGYIEERRRRRDPLIELLDNAPAADEPTTPEEEAPVSEARAELKRGETIPLEQDRRELG